MSAVKLVPPRFYLPFSNNTHIITQPLGPENANVTKHETIATEFMGYTHCFTVTSDSSQCNKAWRIALRDGASRSALFT